MKIGIFIVSLLFLSFVSCKDKGGTPATGQRPGKNEMADLNKYLVEKDQREN